MIYLTFYWMEIFLILFLYHIWVSGMLLSVQELNFFFVEYELFLKDSDLSFKLKKTLYMFILRGICDFIKKHFWVCRLSIW